MTLFFDSKYRKIVKKLHYLMFDSDKSPAIYRMQGVPQETFLRYASQEAMRNILWGKNRKKDGQQLKKIRSEIAICIEKGFIIQEGKNLRIGYEGDRLLSPLYFWNKINWLSLFGLLIAILSIPWLPQLWSWFARKF